MTIRQDWLSIDVDVRDHFLCGLLLGQAINTSEKTCRTNKENKDRKHSRTLYMYLGRSFCRKAFKFLVVISQRLLTSVKQHVLSSGGTERKKGKPGRNVKALTVADVERIVLFIHGFAETHGLVMPGRMNGFNRPDLKLLPSSHTKKYVHEQSKKAQTESGCYAVSIQTFKNEWSRYCPDDVVTRPMTDLCWVCQKNNSLIQHSANLPLDEKTQLIARQEHHLLAVTAERTFYQAKVKASKDTAETNGITTLQQSAPCSRQMSFHYSFDYAQQVHILSNPMQPGPNLFPCSKEVRHIWRQLRGHPSAGELS